MPYALTDETSEENHLSDANTAGGAEPRYLRNLSHSVTLLALLAGLYTLYFAKTLVLPIMVAAFIAMLANSAVKRMTALGINRAVASVFVVSAYLAVAVIVFMLLAEPASKWVNKLPVATEKVTSQLDEVANTLSDLSGQKDRGEEGASISGELMSNAMSSAMQIAAETTPVFAAQLITTIVLSYFFCFTDEEAYRRLWRHRAISQESARS